MSRFQKTNYSKMLTEIVAKKQPEHPVIDIIKFWKENIKFSFDEGKHLISSTGNNKIYFRLYVLKFSKLSKKIQLVI